MIGEVVYPNPTKIVVGKLLFCDFIQFWLRENLVLHIRKDYPPPSLITLRYVSEFCLTSDHIITDITDIAQEGRSGLPNPRWRETSKPDPSAQLLASAPFLCPVLELQTKGALDIPNPNSYAVGLINDDVYINM